MSRKPGTSISQRKQSTQLVNSANSHQIDKTPLKSNIYETFSQSATAAKDGTVQIESYLLSRPQAVRHSDVAIQKMNDHLGAYSQQQKMTKKQLVSEINTSSFGSKFPGSRKLENANTGVRKVPVNSYSAIHSKLEVEPEVQTRESSKSMTKSAYQEMQKLVFQTTKSSKNLKIAENNSLASLNQVQDSDLKTKKHAPDVSETVVPISLKAKTGNFSRREDGQQEKQILFAKNHQLPAGRHGEVSIERTQLQEHNRTKNFRQLKPQVDPILNPDMINEETSSFQQPRVTQEMKSRALMSGSSSLSPLKNFEMTRFRSTLPKNRQDEGSVSDSKSIERKSRQGIKQYSAQNQKNLKNLPQQIANNVYRGDESHSQFQISESRPGYIRNLSTVNSANSLRCVSNDVKQSRTTKGTYNQATTIQPQLVNQQSTASIQNPIQGASVGNPASISHRGPAMASKLGKYMQQRQQPATTSTTIASGRDVVPSIQTTPQRQQPIATVTVTPIQQQNNYMNNATIGHHRQKQPRQAKSSSIASDTLVDPHVQSQSLLVENRLAQDEYIINSTPSVDNLNYDQRRSLSNKRNHQVQIINSKRQEVSRQKGSRMQKPTETHHYHATGPTGVSGSRRHSKSNKSSINLSQNLRAKQQVTRPSYVKLIAPGSTLLATADLNQSQTALSSASHQTISTARAKSQVNRKSCNQEHSATQENAQGVPRNQIYYPQKSSRGKSNDTNSYQDIKEQGSNSGTTSQVKLNTSLNQVTKVNHKQGFLTDQKKVMQAKVNSNFSLSPQRKRPEMPSKFVHLKPQDEYSNSQHKHSSPIVSERMLARLKTAEKQYNQTGIQVYGAGKQTTMQKLVHEAKSSQAGSKSNSINRNSMPVNSNKRLRKAEVVEAQQEVMSPDKRQSMSKSQLNSTIATQSQNKLNIVPVQQQKQAYQRRYIVQQEAQNSMPRSAGSSSIGNRRRQTISQNMTTKPTPEKFLATKSPVKKIYAPQMLSQNLSQQKSRQKKHSDTCKNRDQVKDNVHSQQNNPVHKTPKRQLDQDKVPDVGQVNESQVMRVQNFDSNTDENYKRRQDEIVKKIQSNIKRSEELDILAAQRKTKQSEPKKEKIYYQNSQTKQEQDHVLMTDKFSNLSNILSPKSSVIPKSENMVNNFFKNSVQTPEHLFESTEEDAGQIDRLPLNVGQSKRENTEQQEVLLSLSQKIVSKTASEHTKYLNKMVHHSKQSSNNPFNDYRQTIDLSSTQSQRLLELGSSCSKSSSRKKIPVGTHIVQSKVDYGQRAAAGPERANIILQDDEHTVVSDSFSQKPDFGLMQEKPLISLDIQSQVETSSIVILDDEGPEVEVIQFEKDPLPKTILDVKENTTKLPLSREMFLQTYGDKLYDYEKYELLAGAYVTIYYAADILDREPLTLEEQQKDPDFDDSDGYYKFMLHDHLHYRYEVKKMLGKGSFAQVVAAYDHKTGQTYALKMNRNTEIDHQFAEQEGKLLKFLMNEDPQDKHNIVRLIQHESFRDHQCFFFELLHQDLFEYLKVKEFDGLSEDNIKGFASQILKALAFLEEHSVIHCDLKPENIVLADQECQKIKVVDFGSGCFCDKQAYTYVQSRFYRSPEVILRIPYTEKVDIWSLGCILAELFTGEPLFPGNNEQEQLEFIMEIKGVPPETMIDKSRKKSHYFDTDYSPFLIEDNDYGILRIPEARKLRYAVPSGDLLFLDFLNRCLELDPTDRMSAKEGLQHPWITGDPAGASLIQSRSPQEHKQGENHTELETTPTNYHQSNPSLMKMLYQAEGLEVIEQSNEEDDPVDQAELIDKRDRSREGSSGRSNVTASFLSGDQGQATAVVGVIQASNGMHTDKLDELSVDQLSACFAPQQPDIQAKVSKIEEPQFFIHSPTKQPQHMQLKSKREESPEKESFQAGSSLAYFRKQANKRKNF